MNDGKSIDEMETLPQVELINGPTGDPSQARAMDLRRRRLIRGAVGIAPAVMTLRSGGLAAGSLCTPTVQHGVTLMTNTTDSNSTGWIPSGNSLNVAAGQKCASTSPGVSEVNCPTGYIQKSGTSGVGTVVGPTGPTGPGTSTFYCQSSGGSHISNLPNVAILSSQGATSLAVTG